MMKRFFDQTMSQPASANGAEASFCCAQSSVMIRIVDAILLASVLFIAAVSLLGLRLVGLALAVLVLPVLVITGYNFTGKSRG